MTEINVGLLAKTTPMGIELSGFNTYHCKDTIKSMGGKWQPGNKSWLLPLDAMLKPLMPVLPEWVCCNKARNLDHRNKTLSCTQHYPRGKHPWWFCGHPDARIMNLQLQTHTCRTCAGPDSYGCSYVKGMNYRHND